MLNPNDLQRRGSETLAEMSRCEISRTAVADLVPWRGRADRAVCEAARQSAGSPRAEATWTWRTDSLCKAQQPSGSNTPGKS